MKNDLNFIPKDPRTHELDWGNLSYEQKKALLKNLRNKQPLSPMEIGPVCQWVLDHMHKSSDSSKTLKPLH